MVVQGNDLSGYIGVDPMYQNYANEVDKPLTATEGDSVVLVEEFRALEDALKGVTAKDKEDEDKKDVTDKDDSEDKKDTDDKDSKVNDKEAKYKEKDSDREKFSLKKKS